MGQLQKVLWSKGVLLSPQHMQMQDRFVEDLLSFHLSSLSFFPWGFARLEIDHEALAGGTFALRRGSGIFPDGMVFHVPEADTAPSPKPLQDHWQPDAEFLDVYLAVPEYRSGGHNVSATRGDRQARYWSEMVMLRDENTGLMEKPVQVARKNLKLLVGGESLESSSVLHVGRVRRTAAGLFELDPRFVPPLVDITASDYLMAIARRLVEVLTAKSTALAGTRRQRNRSLAEFGVSDIANFWLLYTANTHLPKLRHLYETARGHPGDLFSAMLDLAGALTTFSATIAPRALPEYDHQQLGPCFTRLDETLRSLLETVVPSRHVTLPLRPTERGEVYATAIDNDRYLSAPQIVLAIQADLREDELLRKVPSLIKVSAANRMEQLIRQALPGVALQHLAAPPSSLPLKLNYQYFALERSGPDWDAVRTSRNLAAYVPADFPNASLELVILLPPETGVAG